MCVARCFVRCGLLFAVCRLLFVVVCLLFACCCLLGDVNCVSCVVYGMFCVSALWVLFCLSFVAC